MKLFTKHALITLLISYFYVFQSYSQTIPVKTANEYVKPYSGSFKIGSNLGVYGNGWTDEKLVSALQKAGGNSVRPTLPEHFVEKWGYGVRLDAFKGYVGTAGMSEITCFIEGPSDAHRDKTVYTGSESSKLFANMYEPIWNGDGTVNPNNYYAIYVYKLIQTYGDYIRFWEVLNEPDLGNGKPSEWLNRAPYPSESMNTRAPIYNYIRMLRITWEVVKKYSPDDYVTTGGIGHPEYLDALLRYSDNPSGGSVTSQYPNKGGAYFDVVSYHFYPQHVLKYWDGVMKYTRTSDHAATSIITHKKAMESTLNKYGYNGSSYPKKHFIVTESGVTRRTSDDHISSDEMQRNFAVKAVVLSQKNDIRQLQFFTIGEGINCPPPGSTILTSQRYDNMGFYENLKRDAPGSEKLTDQGKALKTTTNLLNGYTYDASRTAALSLPSQAEGAAFRNGTNYVYVLWAKALEDTKETASATYSFPSGLNISSVERFEWNYSATNSSTKQSAQGITLTGSPAFFKVGSTTTVSKESQTITFPSIPAKTYGDPDFTVSATASSGLPVAFSIVSGPAKITGSTITLTGSGTVVVEATQSGNTTYNAATPVRQSISVSAAPSEPTPTEPTSCSATGSILREHWGNVSGSSVSDIPLSTKPSSTSQLSLFEAPTNLGSSYGARVSGYICPPQTGDYTFFIAGDDNAELWLSTDESPANRKKIASVTGWTYSREWNKYASQKSAAVRLEAGKKYYIEALHKQGWGSGNLAVAWKMPDGKTEAPVAGSRLSPYAGSTDQAPAPSEPTPTEPTSCSATGSILREHWGNVSGSSVSDIPLSTKPSSTSQLSLFEAPTNLGSSYGARVSGYICPPQTGDYTFFIAGDDNAELWLSTDESPANRKKIASVTGWTYSREWNKYASQKSAAVRLEAGKKYYIEALHKQGWGSGNLAVAWKMPDGKTEAPVAGSRLSPYLATSTGSGLVSASNLQEEEPQLNEAQLKAYPNPFTTDATVQFTLTASEEVSLDLYDIQGRLVRRLYQGTAEANATRSFELTAEGLTRGVYIIRLMTGSKVLTQKIVLEK
ncbi:T9SS C-terminal target domain-containing protein [Pontibacter diazotrophicus]|uniref:T9SS C-terminal target domain-containing protein n=1 Tax=Pontibacter diazotrophicus TaxID=1400979 RepID=A0A3D8L3R2_9BACT|nr:PA14 domain-containing protein [Pontibacter diazotrophicus]RDV11985.1 T9SS C-terminal target domain-containing protein [Pontibacter diazotrophicus]